MHLNLICNNTIDEMARQPAESQDVILTDPPYGVGLKYDVFEDNQKAVKKMMIDWFPEARRILTPTGFMVFSPGVKLFKWYLQKFPPDWIICWFKPNALSPSSHDGFSVWEPFLFYKQPKSRIGIRQDGFVSVVERQDGLTGKHPCPKSLAAWIKLMNCFHRIDWEKARVMDPFMGTGTTGVACAAKQVGSFTGIDISQSYVDLANERVNMALFHPLELPMFANIEMPLFEDAGSMVGDGKQEMEKICRK